ncbi:MAG: NmrA family transcriptional regulator, partial [Planctomycetota bacterium]
MREPFIDIDDLAEVAVEALVNDGHNGEVYEVTGPQLMTFAEIARDLSEATGREIPFVSLS